MRREAPVAILFAGMLTYAATLLWWLTWAGRTALEFLAR
jgi:hypothetical protein